MRIIPFIQILCCCLLAACNSVEPNFPREETLAEELMPLQGITNPIRVEIKHPFLILQNIKLNEGIFHIYDLNSHKLKNTFGKTGEGPDEFTLPWLMQTQLSDLLIADENKFHQFNINKEGIPIFIGTKEPKYTNAIHESSFINDSLFVVDAMYTGPYLHLLSMQDELPKKSWKYRNPDMIDYFADPDMGLAYANEKRIVFCYGYKKQIDFMDTNFNLIKRVKFKFNGPTIINSENQGDVKVSYVYSYLGKHYLYALYFGTSWKENRANSTRGTFLEVFDLDGNPIVRYHLEGRRPVYFAVDEKTFTLYGTGEDGDPEDNLLVYKLSALRTTRN